MTNELKLKIKNLLLNDENINQVEIEENGFYIEPIQNKNFSYIEDVLENFMDLDGTTILIENTYFEIINYSHFNTQILHIAIEKVED